MKTKNKETMRTANNNSNFTVEALVAKYRNFVKEHASRDKSGEHPFSNSDEEYADHQLLITLYKSIAGEKADTYILKGLSSYDKAFMKEALAVDELSFLCSKFKDTVEYIFSERLFGLSEHDWHDISELKPDKGFISAIENLINTSHNNLVFIEDDLMGDVAMLYPQSTIVLHESNSHWMSGFHTDKEENALKMIRFFASGIQYKVVKNLKKVKFDTIIRKVGGNRWKQHGFVTFSSVNQNGQMFCYLNSKQLVSEEWLEWRKSGLTSKCIKTILKYESDHFIMLVEKCSHQSIRMQDTMSGIVKVIPYDEVNETILLPNFYLVDRPDNWIPLSQIADAPERPKSDFPDFYQTGVKPTSKVLSRKDLADSFKDADISKKDLYSVSELSIFSDEGGLNQLAWYESDIPCVFLWGFKNQFRIGYACNVADSDYALPHQMSRIIPKDDIDIRYVAALLFLPKVREQIEAIYCGTDVVSYMPILIKHIFVPNHTDIERTSFLSETNYSAMEDLADDQKKAHEAYVKSIRLRKHALTQSLTSIESMFYALNKYRVKNGGQLHDEDVISRVKGTTVEAAFDFLSKGIEDMMPALEHIAEVEYSFSKPEWIDPEKFIEEYILKNENGWLNFKPIVTWNKGSNLVQKDIINPATGKVVLQKGEPINQFFFPKDALERIFRDIISNALAHGFDNPMRKDYQLRFSWRTDGLNLILEIENNGTAITDDRETSSLFEYGVSTKLHKDGHNGIGCNEIADIIHRYDGDVEIVSTPNDEFTVKYILTFNRFIVKTT